MTLDKNIKMLDKWRSVSTQKMIPLQASIELTNRCNERCKHCYIEDFSDDKDRLLDVEGWNKVLYELRLAGTLYLILLGGEPLLSPHFWSVAKTGSDLGFHVSMISNGLKISSIEIAEKIKNAGIRNITFSLYSLNFKIHDLMTQVPGSWNKLMNAIQYCKQVGLNVSANCLLTKENIDGFFDLEDWCIKQSIELKADPIVTSKLNGNISPTYLRATEEQLISYFRKFYSKWPKAIPTKSKGSLDDFACNAAKGKCAVTSYGDLLPCIEVREPLGNLISHSFQEIWNRKHLDHIRYMNVGEIAGVPNGVSKNDCEHCPGMSKNEGLNANCVVSFSSKVSQIKWKVVNELTIES